MKKISCFLIVAALIAFISTAGLAAAEYTIAKIKIDGNDKVKDSVILHLLPFKEGDVLTRAAIEERTKLGVENLRNERLFLSANIFPFFNADQLICNILIEINGEWTYQFGFGVIPLYLMVEDRAFLGNSYSLGTELSKSRQAVHFTDRHIFNQPLDLRFDVYNQNRMVGKIYGYEEKYFALKGFGGSVSLTRKIAKDQEVVCALSYSREQLGTNLENPALDTELGLVDQNQIKLKTGYRYISNTGFACSATAEVGKVLGEDRLYTRGIFATRYATKLVGNLSGAVKLEYGVTSNQTPYYQLFNISHLNGVRGVFNLAPANQKLLFKSELSYPVYAGFEGVAFLDLGNTWKNSDFSFENFGLSYGLGLRYRAGMPINTTFRLEAALGDKGVAGYFVTGEAF